MTDETEEELPERVPAHRFTLQLNPRLSGLDLERECPEVVDVTHLVQPKIWYGQVQISKPVLKILELDRPKTRLLEALQTEAESMVDDLFKVLNRDRSTFVTYVMNGFLLYLATLPPQQ